VEEAAPGPVFGLFDEGAFDGVAVDVLELLDELGLGEDVEVVVAGLPELGAAAFEELGGFALKDANDCREWAKLWFGEEKVDVLRHEDVAEEVELVALAESFEGVEEDDAGVVVVQVGQPVVTTEGEEVMVAFGLVTLQTARHGSERWYLMERLRWPGAPTPPMTMKPS